MKKIILALLSTFALLSTSQAQGFIGIDIGSNTLNSENGFEDTSPIYGFRAGSQSQDWRVYVGFNYFDSDDSDLTQYEMYVSADYIFTDDSQFLRPFIGGTVGFASTDYDFYEVDNSITWGGQAGLILNVDPNFNIEGGVKYMMFSMDITTAYPYEYYDVFDDKLTFYIGANYKF